MTDERDIEARLVRAVQDRGGLCLKLDSAGAKGIQDRLVLLPGGRVVFVEVKRPTGGRVSVLQRVRQKQMERLGFPAYVVKDEQGIEEVLGPER